MVPVAGLVEVDEYAPRSSFHHDVVTGARRSTSQGGAMPATSTEVPVSGDGRYVVLPPDIPDNRPDRGRQHGPEHLEQRPYALPRSRCPVADLDRCFVRGCSVSRQRTCHGYGAYRRPYDRRRVGALAR